MNRQRHITHWILVFVAVAVALWGCSSGGDEPGAQPEAGSGSDAFPVADPGQPFAWGETGTVTLTNAEAYTILMQDESGAPLFEFVMKKSAVIDPSVDFTVQVTQVEVPKDLAAQYVAVGEYAFEMHVVGESGYGFALRPALTIHFTDAQIEAAKGEGASLDTLKGNLIVLYKEQRSPKWVPQTSVSVDQDAKTVTVSNVAGAGAWRLAAVK